ncbi:hypothetical protein CVT26_009778 [Gymnopilus dilepis]|uniref:Tyr recombinase domain-containing protein n=1 Tax=Gymnopilus dilepis TaxID=231916 RepID=A0A409YIR0_9AGAR|nr:hypothetical protein CVT26_009778 [Gymnopilus dilepis]
MYLQGVQDALDSPEADISPPQLEAFMGLEQEDNDEENWGCAASKNSQELAASSPSSPTSPLGGIIDELSIEVAEGTDRCYRRLMNQFDAWLVEQGLMEEGATIFSRPTHEEAPAFIIAWIMQLCDVRNPDGSFKRSDEYTRTFSHAMKMRSSATYGFSRIPQVGNTPWAQANEQWVGNPSISYQVTRYMVSLKRRKFRDGGLHTMSSRAITSSDIRKLYDFNNSEGRDIILPYSGSTPRSEKEWGGPRARLLVHAVVTLAFVCLLRVDEVLKLQFEDITQHPGDRLQIILPFRKNSQFGGIKPFDLWPFPPENQALCPVRALARWVAASNLTSGHLFRAPGSNDRAPNPVQDTPITSSKFIELFRNNLIDVGIDPTIYAGHRYANGEDGPRISTI